MKKLFALLLAMMMIFSLAACGENNTTDPDKDNPGTSQGGEMQGDNGSGGAALTLENLNETNYSDIAKELFGLEIKPQDGWTLKDTSSPNKVNNLLIDFNVPDGTNGKEVLKTYFDACIALPSGIWKEEIDWETYKVSKGDQFSDFDSFFTAEGNHSDTLTQGSWIYDFDGKSIQFSYSCRMGMVELSLTRLS
ncbi:MAG: hypothetical protein IJP35_04895 [Clostridia bacterium]|nr:hypothetical protein [Clostridia bacterium]